MASKRKSEPTKKPANKRGKKKQQEDDFESDLSDNSDAPPVNEVLIVGEVFEPTTKLPEVNKPLIVFFFLL